MGPGMMGQGGTMGGGSMMSQMNTMMENCNKMMQGMMDRGGPGAPNDQWRKGEPHQREKKG